MSPNYIPNPECVRVVQNHRLSINWLSFSPNSKYFASASDDEQVLLWSVGQQSSRSYHKFTGHSKLVTSVALTDSFLISTSKDNTARLWKMPTGEIKSVSHTDESAVYRGHSAGINCVDISRDEAYFCTASDDTTVKIWSTSSTNKLVSTLSGTHVNWIRHARYSKLEPHMLASCGDDGIVCLWDVRAKESQLSFRRPTHLLCLDWHPTDPYVLALASNDATQVRVVDTRHLSDKKSLQTYSVHDGLVSSVGFHPSGRYLITASHDGTSKILDVYAGKLMTTIQAHAGQVNCAQFSPDGEKFATGGQDHAVFYFKSNLPSLEELAAIEVDDDVDDVRTVMKMSNGRRIYDEEEEQEEEKPPSSPDIIEEVKAIRRQFTEIAMVNDEYDSERFAESPPPSSSAASSDEPKAEEFHDLRHRVLSPDQMEWMKCVIVQLDRISNSIININKRLQKVETKLVLPSEDSE